MPRTSSPNPSADFAARRATAISDFDAALRALISDADLAVLQATGISDFDAALRALIPGTGFAVLQVTLPIELMLCLQRQRRNWWRLHVHRTTPMSLARSITRSSGDSPLRAWFTLCVQSRGRSRWRLQVR